MTRASAALRRHRRGMAALAVACCSGALVAWGAYLAWPPLGFVTAGLLLGGLLLVDFETAGGAKR